MKRPDFKGLEQYLKAAHQSPVFIKNGTCLDVKDVAELRRLSGVYPKALMIKCIASGCITYRFKVKSTCIVCGGIAQIIFNSKTKFIDYVWPRQEQDDLCFECEQEKKEVENARHVAQQNARDSENKSDTDGFIKSYLSPTMQWTIKPKDWFSALKEAYYCVNHEQVATSIKGMSYQDFLKTPYWKAIAVYTKYRAGYRCQMCNSKENLNTHHRTYDIHGHEIDNIKELTVVCQDCHEVHHES